MLGLITAVEGQLKLSDSPKSAHEHQAAAVAEQIADAIQHGSLSVQKDDVKESHADAAAVDQNDKQTPGEQIQAHTGNQSQRVLCS